jgi:hypothetical protein
MYLGDVTESIARNSEPQAVVLTRIPIGVVCPALTTSAATNKMSKKVKANQK